MNRHCRRRGGSKKRCQCFNSELKDPEVKVFLMTYSMGNKGIELDLRG